MVLTVSQSTNTYPGHTLCILYAKQPYIRLHYIMQWCHYVINTRAAGIMLMCRSVGNGADATKCIQVNRPPPPLRTLR